ncbi:Peroxisomal N(1)-acetyl-spermine/spermidine oxidase [Holothuria leucospilota]|uniref:Peroxisomal N(1)-acetyl-spermine/spermidine oxidase n=1 Tax=Holothuria leucospilota TaxID=206669 RepID=A0A9Q0YPL5_HOLLE|nr:Peroxisomal N(1)-acetyl-spermine/spermidine oxidase [Holothuria leucospilota]
MDGEVTHLPLKVAVIGAGISGLSTAQRLIKSQECSQTDVNVNIYEASDRIGGRIHTCKFGKGHVEKGAAWVHGYSMENPLLELPSLQERFCNDQRETSTFAAQNLSVLTEKGEAVSLDVRLQAQEIFTYLLDGPPELRQKSVQNGHHSMSYNSLHVGSLERLNVGTYVYGMLQDYLKEKADKEGRSKRNVFLSVLQQLVSEEFISNACPSLYALDMADFDSYEDVSGGDYQLPGGYQTVIDSISQDIPEDHIHLSHPVERIEWHGANNASNEDQHGPITLHFKNGQTVTADIVVVTSSLGYLKSNSTSLFHPSLPAEKLRSIQKLGFGVVNKIQMQYNNPFWDPDWEGVRFLWDCDSVDKLEGDWSVKDEWYKRVSYIRRACHSEDVLETLIPSAEAHHIESLDATEVAKVMTGLLQKFLNNSKIPEPSEIIVTKWSSDPYIKGSYTYIAAGATNQDIQSLAEPVSVESNNIMWPKICFAGEATSRRFYSTVHGAFASGRREADRILNFVKRLKEQI